MPHDIPVGRSVTVRVPASSANLGPGFDTLGLAVGLYDIVTVEVTASGLTVDVQGEGAGEVPLDGTHLVVRAIREGLRVAHADVPGLAVSCENAIPQSRGLGSSAAAAAAGVCAANALADNALTTDQVIQVVSSFEGHPDNAAASVLGGAVVSWTDTPVDGETAPQYHAIGADVHPDIRATAFIPDFTASTNAVRRVLPSDVSHVDARFNVSRTAVMTVALRTNPELLWEGTRDRLHQPYRADALSVSAEWVNRLRNRGYAAYLSGAGPTIMVLSTEDLPAEIVDTASSEGLRVITLPIAGPIQVNRKELG